MSPEPEGCDSIPGPPPSGLQGLGISPRPQFPLCKMGLIMVSEELVRGGVWKALAHAHGVAGSLN